MRLRQFLQTAGGTLAIACAFALSLPGIQVAKAGETAAAASEFERFLQHSRATATARAHQPTANEESCGAGSVNDSSARMAQLMDAVRRQMEADAAREGAPQVEIVVLNGRGYNYGAPAEPGFERQMIERELAR